MSSSFQQIPGGEAVELATKLLRDIAAALVDTPDCVEITASSEVDGYVLRLNVAPSDTGKIIGKQGRTARSIRTVLTAAGMKLNCRFTLDIVERKPTGD